MDLTSLLGVLLVAIIVFYLLRPFLQKSPPNAAPVIHGYPIIGCAIQFGKDPIGTFREGYKKYGEIFTLKMFGNNFTCLVGPEAHTLFFKTDDDDLSQKEAYKWMIPVFGPGVVFDCPPSLMKEQMKFMKTGLGAEKLRSYSPMIAQEALEFLSTWKEETATVDLLKEMNNLTVLTASRCLLGKEIRDNPQVRNDFARLYHDLEGGINSISFFYPYVPIPAHIKRDRARKKIAQLFSSIIKARRQLPDDQKPADLLQIFMDCEYKNGDKLTDEQISGLLISALFAGQHTSSITATWTGLFLAANPAYLKEVLEEQEEIRKQYGDDITFDAIRSATKLELAVRESLRMYPPLIILMRKAMTKLTYKQYEINPGDLVAVSPGFAMRLEKVYENPSNWDPHRLDKDRKYEPYSYLAFGGGRHGCPGENFGVLQVKTIWSVLLRNFDISLPGGKMPEPDYTNLVIGPKQPALFTYKRKKPAH